MKEFPKNISAEEMGVEDQPKSSKLYTNALKVAENLQAIRDYYNKNGFNAKINVHVGYRSESHNKMVGGVQTSQHLTAEAVDFSTYETIPLQTVFNDIKNGVITLPHKLSQLILEESKINKGKWGWIHLAIFTDDWAKFRKSRNKTSTPNQWLVKRNDSPNYQVVTENMK
jgi:hypothetical protein